MPRAVRVLTQEEVDANQQRINEATGRIADLARNLTVRRGAELHEGRILGIDMAPAWCSGYTTTRIAHRANGTMFYDEVRPVARRGEGVLTFGTPDRKSERRAKVLLYKTIGKARYRQYLRHKRLDVQGHKTGYWYRLRDGHMIDILDGAHKGARLCIGSAIPVPGTDNLIAQMLMATGDEERLWKESNYWPGGNPIGHWSKKPRTGRNW